MHHRHPMEFTLDEEKSLVARARVGDADARVHLFAYLRPVVQSAAAGALRRTTGRDPSLELTDVMQQLYCHLLVSNVLDKWDPRRGRLRPYVSRDVSWKAPKLVRRDSRMSWSLRLTPIDDLDLLASHASLERQTIARHQLDRVLDKMSPTELELVRRLDVGGERVADVARGSGRSCGAVYQEHHRLRVKARACVRQDELDEGGLT